MKAKIIIVAFLIIQAKASFLYDFTRALSSVESAVSKLVNDVVTDVETTIHCTILAIEQVLTISGVLKEPRNESHKCDPNYELPLKNFKVADRGNQKPTDNVHQQINSSISKVNESLNHLLDNGGHEKLKKVEEKYTRRLNEVSHLLRQELEKISNRVHKKFKQDADKLSLETLWNDMKILHDVEENNNNISEVNEISLVLNEAINVLHLNTTSEIKSDVDKIQVIMQELEHDADNNVPVNFNVDLEISQWKEKRSNLLDNPNHKLVNNEETPTSFKDIASQLLNDTNKNRKKVEDYTNKLSMEIQNKSLQIEKSRDTIEERSAVSGQDESKNEDASVSESDYYTVFDKMTKEERSKAIDSAKNIIKNNYDTDTIFNFLNKNSNSGTDVYDSSELSGFGGDK